MEHVTDKVITETQVRGSNPSIIRTSAGVVLIDTPQLPTKAVEWRHLAEREGPIRYLINTEHHVDHIFGNYYFKGAGTVVHHQGVADNFMVVTPDLDPFAYAAEGVEMDDLKGASIFPERGEYYEDPNAGDLIVQGDHTFEVGQHTFHLLHTPGHTPGQMAVYVPQERVVFTGDTVFSECQTWLMSSDIDQWFTALNRIADLDVDVVVPGHGPVTTLAYLDTQRRVLREWQEAVVDAVARGWTREETMERVSFADRYPVDVGQGHMMRYIQQLNARSLFDKTVAESS